MSTITTSPQTVYQDWFLPGQGQRSITEPPDHSPIPSLDSQDATRKELTSSVYLGTACNRPSQVDPSWVSLARAAQKRWRRENPF